MVYNFKYNMNQFLAPSDMRWFESVCLLVPCSDSLFSHRIMGCLTNDKFLITDIFMSKRKLMFM